MPQARHTSAGDAVPDPAQCPFGAVLQFTGSQPGPCTAVVAAVAAGSLCARRECCAAGMCAHAGLM